MVPQKYEAAQLFSTLIIFRNVSCAANQYIRMISEASCDTEIMATKNSKTNVILKYIHIENSFKLL